MNSEIAFFIAAQHASITADPSIVFSTQPFLTEEERCVTRQKKLGRRLILAVLK